MPAPTANLPIVGNIVTAEGRNAALNDALAALYATANPEDRERAEDAADRADLAATASAASAAAALLSEAQAAIAALAAGAPIVIALTGPVPANGTVELLKLDAGLQVHEVVAGAWVLRGWLVGPKFDTVALLLASTAATLGPVGQIVDGGGFRYQVAASGATDHHVTTTGGVKLYALLSESGQYAAAQFSSLATAFFVSARAKKPLVLSGAYTVTQQLLGIISGDAELHLVCSGDVVITVDPAATWFRELVLLQTDTINNVSVRGGSLTIIGNKKISNGLWLRHLEAADGGTMTLACPVTVLDLEGAVSPAVAVAGIVVLGRYTNIVMQSPRVEDVTRLSTGGECGGITCSGFVGDVSIYSPVVKRIFTGPSLVDADGVKTFGFAPGGEFQRRRGRVRIYDPVYEDCQGRSHKDQCGDTVIYRPRVARNAAVVQAIGQGNEFDFQSGGGLVIDAICEYTSDGAISPLGNSHYILGAQHILNNSEMATRLSNLTIISDAPVQRTCLFTTNAAAQRSLVEVDGVKLIPKAGFTATMIERAVVECNAGQIAAKATKTRVVVKNVDGPHTVGGIGYTGYDGSADLTSKLSWSVTKCNNTLGPVSAFSRAFFNLSGSAILAVEDFEMHGNNGYRDTYEGAFALDFRTISVGTVITVNIANVAATNPPPWGVSGYAHIRCEGQWFGNLDRTVYVMKDNGVNLWATRDGGANWGVIK